MPLTPEQKARLERQRKLRGATQPPNGNVLANQTGILRPEIQVEKEAIQREALQQPVEEVTPVVESAAQIRARQTREALARQEEFEEGVPPQTIDTQRTQRQAMIGEERKQIQREQIATDAAVAAERERTQRGLEQTRLLPEEVPFGQRPPSETRIPEEVAPEETEEQRLQRANDIFNLWNVTSDDPRYDPSLDTNGDGVINQLDLPTPLSPEERGLRETRLVPPEPTPEERGLKETRLVPPEPTPEERGLEETRLVPPEPTPEERGLEETRLVPDTDTRQRESLGIPSPHTTAREEWMLRQEEQLRALDEDDTTSPPNQRTEDAANTEFEAGETGEDTSGAPRDGDGNIDPDALMLKLQGAFQTGGYDLFFEELDRLNANYSTVAGTTNTDIEDAASPEEAVDAAVASTDEGPDVRTLAEMIAGDLASFDPEAYAALRRESFQAKVDEGLVRLARRFAMEIDPDSGEAEVRFSEYMAQVAQQASDLEATIQQEINAIQQGNIQSITQLLSVTGQQDLANEQLNLSEAQVFGGEAFLSLNDLRVKKMPPQYEGNPEAFSQADPVGFKKWIAEIEGKFLRETGRMPSDQEIERLMQGHTVVGRPTLEYQRMVQEDRQFYETVDIEKGLAVGMIEFGGEFVETLANKEFQEGAQQFDETMAAKLRELGFEEDQIKEMIRASRVQTENSTRQLAFDIASNMAALTGKTGFGTEEVTSGMFGVDSANMLSRMEGEGLEITDENIQEQPEYQALLKFGATLMGRDITEGEALALLRGEALTMDGVPTLEARQLAATVTLAQMDQFVEIDRIAKEYDIEDRKLVYYIEQSDRQWNLSIGNVAQVFDLPEDEFRNWRYNLDARLRGVTDPVERGVIEKEAMNQFVEDHPDISMGDFINANDLHNETVTTQNEALANSLNLDYAQTDAAVQELGISSDVKAAVWGALPELDEAMETVTHSKASNRFHEQHPGLKAEIDRLITDNFGPLALGDVEDETTRIGIAQEISQQLTDPNTDIGREGMEKLKALMQREFNGIVTDDNLENFLYQYVNSYKNPSGDSSDGYGITIKWLPPNWVGNLETETQELLVSILNGAPFSPQFQQNVNPWNQLITSIGQMTPWIVQAFFGGRGG
jgi:hypothetical protein